VSDEFEKRIKEACDALERCFAAEAHPEFTRLKEEASTARDAARKAAAIPASLRDKTRELEREVMENLSPAEELNDELRAYLGRDELRFEVRDTGYVLTRSGQPVKDLSEGEKTAIAFLYFLKSIQDRGFDACKGIVVIDDPVSSLDDNSLFSAFSYMKERTKDCGQLFILTHSFPFFRQVKNWLHHHNRNRRRARECPARFFLVRTEVDGGGDRRASIGPLDKLLEEYESEYHYLFKLVYVEAAKEGPSPSLESHYGMPNVARRLLEGFLAFRYPDKVRQLYATLQDVDFDANRKTRILRFVQTYSHTDRVAEPGHDPYLLSNTRQVLGDVLDLVKHLDREHFDRMEALATRDEVGTNEEGNP
jgi:wobble nucleotide-excising tRNase